MLVGAAASKSARRIFGEQGYMLVSRANAALPDADLAVTSAVVISQKPDKPLNVFAELASHARRLLDWDCQVFVRVAAEPRLQGKGHEIVVNALRTLSLPEAKSADNQIGLPPFVYVCDSGEQLADIARLIRQVGSGRAPNLYLSVTAFDSDHRGIELQPEDALLVRRAFWDCSSVQLRSMAAGLSGASIYRAHASLTGGVPGPWPHPFFVKLGSRAQIEQEYRGYRDNARMYIPFHLGPRLDVGRSGLGSSRGVLVGDLVEEGQLLKHCARHGRAVPAIANLFSKTLRSWYLTSSEEADQSISGQLIHIFPDVVPPHRLEIIRGLGATLALADLRQRFIECNSTPVRIGHIHGDLHAGNILVRSTDAVVIDFEKTTDALPILYDAASVEGGLLVDGFLRDGRKPSELLASLEPLYSGGGDLRWMIPCHPGDPSSWFYDCVHQIRIQARQMQSQEFQYAATLALVLIKKACNEQRFDDKAEALRAVAYVLGERLLLAKK